MTCLALVSAPTATAQVIGSSSSSYDLKQPSDAASGNNVKLIPTDLEIGGINQIVRLDIENGSFEKSSTGDIQIKNGKGENVGGLASGDKWFANGGVNISFELLDDGAVLAHSKIVQPGLTTYGIGPSCFGNILATAGGNRASVYYRYTSNFLGIRFCPDSMGRPVCEYVGCLCGLKL